jgi:pimeloyl-ACP methyl ester carboxylesterase
LTLGGVRQWLLGRGRRAESPILLKLHGGPGQAEMATARLNGLLEDDFVVAEWDQRGLGKSGAAIQPATAMNVSQLVDDTIELTRAPDAALRQAEADRRRPFLGQRARTHGDPGGGRTCSARSSAPG